MSVEYKAILPGYMDIVSVMRLIQETYGGTNYTIYPAAIENMMIIGFNENRNQEKIVPRRMHVWLNGGFSSDYQDITQEPMTYISLDDFGDARLIINAILAKCGGYFFDEAGQQRWLPWNVDSVIPIWVQNALDELKLIVERSRNDVMFIEGIQHSINVINSHMTKKEI